ncbi:MAG: Cell division protein FtsL [Candidatus Magasanikbacteria bacterium GW2011_GWD2_43_18]|nr:MAG: Cell division protein FtsL [Candidatus Magasanikbacteria bacterium GW2011_GWC2_42_27]KKT03928.1 MAG: Cell division protein FtsL [Candidatus Magasanikbacteria bacterium GW2011_GWD2_43_18]KKT25589.1 MAG: Cell division protein FtsL [Candidatus Magasanikbacteria bacterium GW2011_GWA2_43_9]
MRRFFSSRLFLILLFVTAVLVAISYARAYYQDYAIRQEIKELEQEVQQLQTKKLESFELLKYVSSPDYVEEKARVEFNLKKPGEHVIALPEDSAFHKDDGVNDATSIEDLAPLKNPAKWWYYIMHISHI